MANLKIRLEFNHGSARSIGFNVADRLVTDVTRQVLSRAVATSPVDKGRLRSNHRSRIFAAPNVVRGTIFNDVNYAAAVHDGSRPHVIVPKRPGGVLRFRKGGKVVFTRRVQHPGYQGNPWLYRALVEVGTRRGFVVT